MDRRYIYQGMLSTVGLAPARPIKVDGSALTFGPVSPTGKVAKLLFYSEGYCTYVCTGKYVRGLNQLSHHVCIFKCVAK